jgi:hypothetical protein
VVRLVSFGGGVFQEPLCRLDGVDGIHHWLSGFPPESRAERTRRVASRGQDVDLSARGAGRST